MSRKVLEFVQESSAGGGEVEDKEDLVFSPVLRGG